MGNNQIPRVLIVEKEAAAVTLARTVMLDLGWKVAVEEFANTALEILDKSADDPFCLFVCGYEVKTTTGEAKGTSILGSAKGISPLTQRMLWLPGDDPETLVEAINSADINSCITYPVAEDELKAQAQKCIDMYNRDAKHQQFLKVISRHNKKMYQMARNLKRKDDRYRILINEKKSRRDKLRRQLKKLSGSDSLTMDITLARLIRHKPYTADPESFKKMYASASEYIEHLVQKLAEKHGIEWRPPETEAGEPTEAPPGHPDILARLIKHAYIFLLENDDGLIRQEEAAPEPEDKDLNRVVLTASDDPFELIVSEDNTSAYVKKMPGSREMVDVEAVQDLIMEKGICYGVISSEAIKEWVEKAAPEDDPLMIAKANPPVYPVNGSVEYFFQTDYTNPGKVREDGSIDFRDRGDVPTVTENQILARKTPPLDGRTGINIYGVEIPVAEALDPAFSFGSGAELSEDGLEIRATMAGQPHLDPMGKITVNPEYVVKGDVDYETGNIHFNGNIVIKGTVKPGFTVKGVSLTAHEIEGATIILSGELNVSSGITDADINAVGNIHTKFIHNSRIHGFGDFTVHREIIDSTILLSGGCYIPTGHIIASSISAKKGVEAGTIGTLSTEPSLIRVGVEDHINVLLKRNSQNADMILGQIQEMTDQIAVLDEQKVELDQSVSEQAYTQDIGLQKIRDLKKLYGEIKNTDQIQNRKRVSTAIEQHLRTVKQAGVILQEVLTRQEAVESEKKNRKRRIRKLEAQMAELAEERKTYEEYSKKHVPDPTVTVNRYIRPDTRVQGPNSSLSIADERRRCKIHEAHVKDEAQSYYEMRISDLGGRGR